jgi:hypothetical protein
MTLDSPAPQNDDRKLQNRVGRRSIVLIAFAVAVLAIGAWSLWNRIIPVKGPAIPLLALVAAPSGDDQKKLIAAFKAHPNPPLTTDALPPLGSDAAGLATLFEAMLKSELEDGAIRYSVKIAAEPGGHDYDATYVVIIVSGDPSRVVKGRVEPSYTP